jgi:hypothetical protein
LFDILREYFQSVMKKHRSEQSTTRIFDFNQCCCVQEALFDIISQDSSKRPNRHRLGDALVRKVDALFVLDELGSASEVEKELDHDCLAHSVSGAGKAACASCRRRNALLKIARTSWMEMPKLSLISGRDRPDAAWTKQAACSVLNAT